MGDSVICVCWTCVTIAELAVDEFIAFYEDHWGHEVTVRSLGSDSLAEYTHLPPVEAKG